MYDSSWFDYYFKMPDDESALFYTIAGMVIAMLAIVLAFSTQLTARSSEGLPTRYFWLFARDLLLDFYYILIGGIALVNLFFGLTINDLDGVTRVLFLKIGLVLAAWSIALLYASYRRLIKILSHEHLIKKISLKNKREIDELALLARKTARITLVGRRYDDQQRSTAVASMYNSLGNRIKRLSNEVEGLVELHNQHLRKDDRYAASNFLTAATGLIVAYVWSRRESAILLPNREFPITPLSNLSDFLLENLETLKPIWNTALAANDIPTIRSYLRSIQGIVRTTLSLNHVGSDDYENPAYDTAYHHLRTLIDESIEKENLDALFEASPVLEQVAEMAIPHSYIGGNGINSILDDFKRIAQITALKKDLSSANYNLIRQLSIVTVAILRQKQLDDVRLSKLTETLGLSLTLAALSPYKSVMTDTQISNFAQNLLPNVMQDMSDTPNTEDIDKMIQVSKVILDVEEQLVSASNGLNYTTQAFNTCISSIVHDILKMRDSDIASARQKRDIDNLLQKVAYLPSKFKPLNELKRFDDIGDINDNLIQAALVSLKHGDVELATKIFDSFTNYLRRVNDPTTTVKSSIQADILRSINRAKLIGALARKLRKQNLQRHVKDTIIAIETEYHARYYPNGRPSGVGSFPSYDALRPHPDQMGLMGLRAMRGLFRDAYEIFFSEYTTEDFDSFDDYIWRP